MSEESGKPRVTKPWTPEGHIARVKAMLPEDGSVLPIEVLARRMGNATVKGTVSPLRAALAQVTGIDIVRHASGKGGVMGVRLVRRVEIGTDGEVCHGAAETMVGPTGDGPGQEDPSRNRDA